MVERRAGRAVVAVDPRGDAPHLSAQALEQAREGPVELIAEAAAPPADDLVNQVRLVQRDRLAQVNAQVLKRHGRQVRPVQVAQRLRVQDQRPGHPDPGQVGGKHAFGEHPASLQAEAHFKSSGIRVHRHKAA